MTDYAKALRPFFEEGNVTIPIIIKNQKDGVFNRYLSIYLPPSSLYLSIYPSIHLSIYPSLFFHIHYWSGSLCWFYLYLYLYLYIYLFSIYFFPLLSSLLFSSLLFSSLLFSSLLSSPLLSFPPLLSSTRNWFNDEEFCRQRLQGMNPEKIERVRKGQWGKLELMLNFCPSVVENAKYICKGQTMEEAVANNQIYVVDYSIFADEELRVMAKCHNR